MIYKEPKRDAVLRDALHLAMCDYAEDWLREHGGTAQEGVKAANEAVGRQTSRLSRALRGDVSEDIKQIQADATTFICGAKEKLWTSSGGKRCWHRVATPTRALCGTAIIGGEWAWALDPDPAPPVPYQDYRERCKQCVKL